MCLKEIVPGAVIVCDLGGVTNEDACVSGVDPWGESHGDEQSLQGRDAGASARRYHVGDGEHGIRANAAASVGDLTGARASRLA